MMADPRRETDATLALLEHWVQEVEATTAAIRAEIARMDEEGESDASEDADGER